MSAKSDAIAAAKAPVIKYMAQRAAAEAAILEMDNAATEAISKLIEVAGQSGPFRFDSGDVVFRKPRDANGDPYHVSTFVERKTL